MEKEKVLFVYNPRAGKGTLRNKLADIIDLMMKRQWDVSIAATQKAGDAAEYIIQKGIGCDRVICSGGDGTLHEVIHGLMTLPPDMRPACGYIPTGTVNDFANSIRLPKRVIPCAQIAVGDKKDAFRWCGKVGKNQKLSYKGADRFGNLGAGLYSWYGDKCKIGSRIKII